MNSHLPATQREKRPGPNPLNCPPSLVNKKHGLQNLQVEQIDSMQHTQKRLAPAQIASPTNQQNGKMMGPNNNNNLQEHLLTSLASQLMSQRSMLMNYDLSGNNALLSSLGGTQYNQGFSGGSNQGLLSLMNEKKVNQQGQIPAQGRMQPVSTVTRVPCQARGMSTDHNALTAYLEIPNDAIHGQRLMCSHAACRAIGVKFRYCFYCKKPVTKQNFRSRHLHADLDPKANSNVETRKRSLSGESKGTTAPICLPAKGALPNSRQTSITSIGSIGSFEPPKPDMQKASMFGTIGSFDSKDLPESKLGSGRITPEDVKYRRLAWSAILQERPADVTQLPVWISKVLSFSDPEKHVATNEPPKEHLALGETKSEKESTWDSLLWERPKGNHDNEKMTFWLVKVLETSCPGKSLGGRDLATASNFSSYPNHMFNDPNMGITEGKGSEGPSKKMKV